MTVEQQANNPADEKESLYFGWCKDGDKCDQIASEDEAALYLRADSFQL